MNIAIVSPFNPTFVKNLFDLESVPNINGNATAVNILVAALVEMGNKVYVYTTITVGEKIQILRGKNIQVSIISKEFHPRGMSNIRVVKRLKEAVANNIQEIDVIHAHWTYEYAAAARFFDSKKPVFCTIRDWYPYQKSLAKNLGEKYNWWLNGILFSYVMSSKRIRFIANSTYTYNMIYKSYPEKNIVIIPNPVQRKYIIKEKIKVNKNDVFISICQSPEEKRKNIDILLKAFQLFRKDNVNCMLIIVGSYTEEWKNSRKNNLDGVVLTGSVNHNVVYEYIDKSDVLVHPSLEETLGNILLEAMARRVVCIGGEKAGAVPEVLGHGERGFVCNVSDAVVLAETMKKATDKNCVKPLVDNATHFLTELYADNTIAQKHIDLYQK